MCSMLSCKLNLDCWTHLFELHVFFESSPAARHGCTAGQATAST